MDNFIVYLSVHDFEIDPESVVKTLKLKNVRIRRKGEAPKGWKNPSSEDIIEIYSTKSEDEELDDHINDILENLGVNGDLASKFPSTTGFILRVVISIPKDRGTPTAATFIGKSNLRKLASLGCELDFDIYG